MNFSTNYRVNNGRKYTCASRFCPLELQCSIYQRVIAEYCIIESCDEDFEEGFNGKFDLQEPLILRGIV